MSDEEISTETPIADENEETTNTDDFTSETALLILNHLDGWILENPDDVNLLDYNKKVTLEEVKQYYNTSVAYATSYLGFTATDTINEHLLPFIYMWCAGLLWKKYDVRPNDLTDETYPIGYGDQLIITAKTGLKPYKKYSFTAW